MWLLLPGPSKYVTSWHFGRVLVALGHDFAYFSGPGRLVSFKNLHPYEALVPLTFSPRQP